MNDQKFYPRADKSLGQHFLNDQKVILSITLENVFLKEFSSEIKSIIEIGPGPGILTQKLASLEKRMAVVEMDQRFNEQLSLILPEEMIQFGDALEINLEQFIQDKNLSEDIWLVSNLPYNVSVPLFLKFLKTPAIKYLTLMFQKEVGLRILKEMGSLMALSQTYFDIQTLISVRPGAFIPPPQVDSLVLNFKRRPNPEIPLNEFSQFEKFLRNLFQMKRKQIHKVLRSFISSTEKIDQALLQCQINRTDRAEILSPEKVRELFRSLS